MQESFSPRHKWRDLRDCATASVSDAQIATMVNGMKASIDKIPLGITDDEVPLGSHLIHFWQTDEEFERGVRFLELGIADEFQHCVLFGHDEANDRVLSILRKTNRVLDGVLGEGRLVIMRRETSASVKLAYYHASF